MFPSESTSTKEDKLADPWETARAAVFCTTATDFVVSIASDNKASSWAVVADPPNSETMSWTTTALFTAAAWSMVWDASFKLAINAFL